MIMCTVSWIRGADDYQLFFNRDERRTRLQALPPRLLSRDGVRFLAPVDGDFGGTWISTNEFGISLCLLNGANLTGSSGPPPTAARSLGLLLPELISSANISDVYDRLQRTDFAYYAPLTLVGMGLGAAAVAIEWDGRQRVSNVMEQSCFMLTSSSFQTEAVCQTRQTEFARIIAVRTPDSSPTPDQAAFLQFHASHVPSRSAYSTCMHRPDAETVSFSQITATAQSTELLYSPAAPCQQVQAASWTLPRRNQHSG